MTANSAVTVSDLVLALREQQGIPNPVRRPADHRTDAVTPLVGGGTQWIVVGAHPGAGASTVAVALSEAMDAGSQRDEHVVLVDLADPEASGLAATAGVEVASPADGWRAGRREQVTVLRPTGAVSRMDRLTADVRSEAGATVVDVGPSWPWCAGLLEAQSLPGQRSQVVLVCRASVPGVRSAERALAGLPEGARLVAVGASKWPRVVAASFGPHVTRAIEDGRTALVPSDRQLAVEGIDERPMPPAVVAAVTRLVGPPAGAPGLRLSERRRRKVLR